jgi:hypothetical protein
MVGNNISGGRVKLEKSIKRNFGQFISLTEEPNHETFAPFIIILGNMPVRCTGEKVCMVETIPHAPNLVFVLYINTAPQSSFCPLFQHRTPV